MPLSKATDNRKLVHTREYRFQGFEREDGAFDIEGHMTDAKPYSFPNSFRGRIDAGEPIHDMWLRVTVNLDMEVLAIEAVTDGGPYRVCPAITPNFQRVVGMKMGPGWRQRLKRELGGVEGCTHLVEMLGAMATAAYQSMWPALARRSQERREAARESGNDAEAEAKRPALIDSCHAYASNGEVVRQYWPRFYSGDDAPGNE